jgi:NAD(P)-dependent dehydrogenase (short-subunit alcohol dehydrogenase family)
VSLTIGQHFIEQLGAPGADPDRAPGRGQIACHGRADAGRCSRDQSTLARHRTAHALPFPDAGVSVESRPVIGPGDGRLDGRVAIVTGAAVGIGEAIAVALAQFGADVAVCDRDADGLAGTVAQIEAAGRGAFSQILDVRDGDAMNAFVSAVVERFGHIEVVVNNAGGGFSALFADVTDKGQDTLIRENFTSVTQLVRAALPHLDPGASIINLTSVEAHRAGPTFAVYSAMKADVLAPLARRGSADDVAGAAVWLAGDLSAFVTGSTVHVDGGTWAAGGWRRRPDGTFHP